MKVKTLTRNPDFYIRETKRDIHKINRNYDPSLHMFQHEREYTRALNSVKLERVFAKPFIGNLNGHKDSVSSLCKHPVNLSVLISGAFDGEVRVWNLPGRECTHSFLAHDGIVRGITQTTNENHFITIGDDKIIKTWNLENAIYMDDEGPIPVNTVLCETVLTAVSHNRKKNQFATCGEVCHLWDANKSKPIKSFKWGMDSLHDVKFNPVQTNLLAVCSSDRSIILYDTREVGPLRKVIMSLRSNKLCWNPMEVYTFTCANEDYNLYTFDMRNLKTPVNVHMDHVEAVMDIDYSPTGKEFVSGSYDKSIRIFEVNKGRSREVYHTKRMQRILNIAWSLDNKYILSGSDEMNIRVWKARSSEKLGVLKPREKLALQYGETLKAKYGSHPKVRRIARHRQVPKHIYNAQAEVRKSREKIARKESNRRIHSKKGDVPFTAERQKHVLAEEK